MSFFLQPVDERLEQARKVQQLLAALKQPQGGASGVAPAPGAPPSGGPPLPQPPSQMPQGAPTYYPPPPGMQPPYPGVPPPNMTTYGAPPPASVYPSGVPPNATPQPGMAPPPPSAASLAAAGIPPNILAMLQQAQNMVPAGAAAPQAPGYPQYGMPPPPNGAAGSSIPPGTAPQDYATLMAYLVSSFR